jgi:hypothetical protein
METQSTSPYTDTATEEHRVYVVGDHTVRHVSCRDTSTKAEDDEDDDGTAADGTGYKLWNCARVTMHLMLSNTIDVRGKVFADEATSSISLTVIVLSL